MAEEEEAVNGKILSDENIILETGSRNGDIKYNSKTQRDSKREAKVCFSIVKNKGQMSSLKYWKIQYMDGALEIMNDKYWIFP